MEINLVAFQGPSASGKSSLQHVLGLPRVITWTSRAKRIGEIDGVHYHFTDKERMLDMLNEEKLLEITEYQGNYYGTSIESILNIVKGAEQRSIVVDAEGAKKLKHLLNERLLLIGVAANFEECRRRLEKRKISQEDILQRLATFQTEIDQLSHCDIIMYNTDENLHKSELVIRSIKNELESAVK